MSADPLRRPLDWPGERRFYLTLDFECDYGTALPDNRYGAVERVGDLVELLEQRGVPLTSFVQTAVLDEIPETIKPLLAADVAVEFHPHSHTHTPRSDTDVAEEVQTSTQTFREFFGYEPTVYRFPNGNIRPSDYEVLSDLSYEFDASLFPSWRPGHYNNSGEPIVPFWLPEYDLYEVPFTVFSDRLRIPTGLAYCRLVGLPLRWLLANRPPSSVVFNVHMHDLFNPDAYSDLPPLYRAIYARNADGFRMLDQVLETFSENGYDFEPFAALREDLSN